jgi:serine/threonine-protein kinase|tara:strand:+ start:21432 stop:23678 length:2247 start_codon:yes stop_codon:yes gene_type:complete
VDKPFPAYQGSDPYIFVSYVHEDSDVVYPEIQWLKDQGFNIWFDEGISPGGEWRKELADSIEGSSLFLYFISPHSIESNHCKREVNLAVDLEKQLLAVHLEETQLPSEMALVLSTIQAIMRFELSDQEYRFKLLKGTSDYIQRGIAQVAEVPTAGVDRPARFTAAGILTGLMAGCVITALVLWVLAPSDPQTPRPLQRFTLDPPANIPFNLDLKYPLVISADGGLIAFSAFDEGIRRIYSRSLGELGVNPIRGAENAFSLTLSPDAEWAAFLDQGLKLKKVRIAGGTPITLCEVIGNIDLAWGPSGMIVFSSFNDPDRGGLLQVSDEGGTPSLLTTPKPGEIHKHASFLPDGSGLVFTIGAHATGMQDTDRVAVLSFATGAQRILTAGASPQVTSSGHLVFFRANALWAAAFDLDRLEVVGQAVTLVDDVSYYSGAHYSLSNDGTLIYFARTAYAANKLVWVDREGREEVLTADAKRYRFPRISPDGKRLAVLVDSDTGSDIWIQELDRDLWSRLTHDDREELNLLWSPDGTRILYSLEGDRGANLYQRSADGTGEALRLTTSSSSQFAYSWSADGQRILFYQTGTDSGTGLGLLTLDEAPKAEGLLATRLSTFNPALSPDERHVAYQLLGGENQQIYVRPFPDLGSNRWHVSNGGRQPWWGPQGDELFYWGSDSMMVVPVETNPTFSIGMPKALFKITEYSYVYGRNYALTPDGERFLMVRREETAEGKMNVVLNWFDELERLVPTE